MFSPKTSSVPNLTIALSLLILAVIAICTILTSSSNSTTNKSFFNFHCYQCEKPNSTSPAENSTAAAVVVVDELEAALREAATEDKTVIIAVVNRAYAEQNDDVGGRATMLDLFLEGLWLGEGTRGLVDHLLVVAVDQTAYERCQFRRLHCFRLETEGVDFGGEKVYMSGDFIKMMWRRTRFLTEVLRRGYNFIFTDTDIVWLRNPFLRLSSNGTEDLQISTDSFIGDSWSQSKFINTGFYYVRTSNKTVSLFELWHDSKARFPDEKEQDVLVALMHEGVFKNISLSVRFLDTLYFSGFCQDSKDIRKVTTVHANCCRSISAKVADLSTILRAWKRWRRTGSGSGGGDVMVNGSVVHVQQAVPWSPFHVACANSWMTKVNTTN